MTITIQLIDSCLDQIADAVAERLTKTETVKSLTIREFANAANISAQSVRRRIKAGIIRASKSDGIVRIPSTEIQRFLGY